MLMTTPSAYTLL